MPAFGKVKTLIVQSNGSTVQVYDFSQESVSLGNGNIQFAAGQVDKTFVYSGDSEAELFAAIKQRLGPIGE